MFKIQYRRAVCPLALLAAVACSAQTLKLRTPEERDQQDKATAIQAETHAAAPAPVTVDMNVPTGTPVKVALDSEVRVRRVGQPIHGVTVEPVYAFNKLLIPVGTGVTGKVSAVDGVSKKVRVMQAMDGNFSPVRAVHVQFDQLQMADGKQLPIQTVTSPATASVLKFVSANAKASEKEQGGECCVEESGRSEAADPSAMEQPAAADPRAGENAQTEKAADRAAARASAIH